MLLHSIYVFISKYVLTLNGYWVLWALPFKTVFYRMWLCDIQVAPEITWDREKNEITIVQIPIHEYLDSFIKIN